MRRHIPPYLLGGDFKPLKKEGITINYYLEILWDLGWEHFNFKNGF